MTDEQNSSCCYCSCLQQLLFTATASQYVCSRDADHVDGFFSPLQHAERTHRLPKTAGIDEEMR